MSKLCERVRNMTQGKARLRQKIQTLAEHLLDKLGNGHARKLATLPANP